jgi:CBS domain containing-hemolysin-like protein
MMAIQAFSIVLSAALLTLAVVVQTCYLESLRLRTRDYATLTFFEETLEPALGVKRELGALAFSLWKHSLLAVCAVPIMGFVSQWLEAAALALLFMLTFAYALPQFLYRRSTGSWLRRLTPLLGLMIFAARPLMSVLNLGRTLSEFGDTPQEPEDSAQGDIEALIEAGAEEGLIEEGDKKLIQTVIEFGDKTVREVMTPRPNVVAISEDADLEDLRRLVINEKYSRIPVFRKDLDHIVGFVHVRDMFEVEEQQRQARRVRELAREIDVVPESKLVQDLLRDMQRDGSHMAAVVDEYGGLAGIVTMEDLLEEVFGEIRDEHEPSADVTRDSDGSFVVAGTFDVDHLSDLVEFTPSAGTEATTVGGLVTEWMGHVPAAGEQVERDGIRLEVVSSSDLRVDCVRIVKLPGSGEAGDGER